MKLTHKQKVKMARKMRTRVEVKNKTSIFLTKAWSNRKRTIEERIRELRGKQNPRTTLSLKRGLLKSNSIENGVCMIVKFNRINNRRDK